LERGFYEVGCQKYGMNDDEEIMDEVRLKWAFVGAGRVGERGRRGELV